MSIESMMPSNHLILCRPLLLLPSIFPYIRVFPSELALHIRWPKYWSFSFSISLSNEYSGLISFRIDWLDLLAVQGTLKSLLQHHSSKASILWHSAFFILPTLTSIHDYWKNHGTPFGTLYAWAQSLSHVWLFATPWTVALQSPLSMGLYRPESWSGLSFPIPGNLLDPGIKPRSPMSPASGSLPLAPPGKPGTLYGKP